MDIYDVIDTIGKIYRWLLIAYILLSWVPNIRDSYIGELLGKIVEPYLAPFRKIIPPIGGMLDVSPYKRRSSAAAHHQTCDQAISGTERRSRGLRILCPGDAERLHY